MLKATHKYHLINNGVCTSVYYLCQLQLDRISDLIPYKTLLKVSGKYYPFPFSDKQTTQTKIRTETDSQDSLQKGKILTNTTDRKGESKTKGERDKQRGALIEFKAMFTFG